ncbi:hypothetical protein GHT06_022833 [Daphnia sinensis]|uniref:Uncharacterized protein n=1 Tax=Daphnia sinensis TaxID=1820382 RepID=A0AAD5PMT6_9CRUS|nr:hypothetical protein GHT06_022833 [Daphnia sinensis]
MSTRLSEDDERKATLIINEMLICMNSSFAPALNPHSIPLGHTVDLDTYAFLLDLKKKCQQNGNFLKNSGSPGNIFTRDQIDLAIAGRNAAIHGRHSQILTQWHVYLGSWRYLTGKLGQNFYLDRIRAASERIRRIANTTRPTNIFFNHSSRQGDDVPTMLTNEMTIAMNMHLAPALVSFSRQIQLVPILNFHGSLSDVDVQGHLKALKDRCCYDKNFLANHATGSNSFIRRQLVLSLLGRNAVAHGKRQKVLMQWKAYMGAWIHVLEKIRRIEHADEVRRILSTMVNIDTR